MKGVLVVAALIVCLMAVIKDGRLLRRAGLSGSCTAIATPRGQTGEWQRCKPGRLAGAPDLSRHGCTVAATQGNVQFWRCPAQIGSAPGT
jgi:hypothetical protein